MLLTSDVKHLDIIKLCADKKKPRLKTSFELNPVAEGKQEIFPFLIKYILRKPRWLIKVKVDEYLLLEQTVQQIVGFTENV